MATFLVIVSYSVYHMFSLYFDIVILVISHFSFKRGTLVLIASILGPCLINVILLFKSKRCRKKLSCKCKGYQQLNMDFEQ